MQIVTITCWEDLFNFFRSYYPAFDELEPVERVRGIWHTLTNIRKNDPGFLDGDDLQFTACYLALLSKYKMDPSPNDIEGVMGEVFPDHPDLLIRRENRNRQIDEMLSGRFGQGPSAEALDWEAELSNLHV